MSKCVLYASVIRWGPPGLTTAKNIAPPPNAAARHPGALPPLTHNLHRGKMAKKTPPRSILLPHLITVGYGKGS